MNNPIFDNRYERKGVVYEFADDYSTVTITQGDATIKIEGNALADLLAVMRASRDVDGKELSSKRLAHMIPTTLSCPVVSWSDIL